MSWWISLTGKRRKLTLSVHMRRMQFLNLKVSVQTMRLLSLPLRLCPLVKPAGDVPNTDVAAHGVDVAMPDFPSHPPAPAPSPASPWTPPPPPPRQSTPCTRTTAPFPPT